MPNRNSLHNLVDTLPEEALESIERVLQRHQKWPLEPPIDVQKLRDQVRERFAKMREERFRKNGQGVVAGFSGLGHVSSTGDASTSMTGWDGDTHVEVEYRVFCGHELEIEERLRISDVTAIGAVAMIVLLEGWGISTVGRLSESYTGRPRLCERSRPIPHLYIKRFAD